MTMRIVPRPSMFSYHPEQQTIEDSMYDRDEP